MVESPLIEVENLKKYFPVTKGLVTMRAVGYVQAVDGISYPWPSPSPGWKTVCSAQLKAISPTGLELAAWC